MATNRTSKHKFKKETPTIDKARNQKKYQPTAGWLKTLGKTVPCGPKHGQATVGLPGIPVNK